MNADLVSPRLPPAESPKDEFQRQTRKAAKQTRTYFARALLIFAITAFLLNLTLQHNARVERRNNDVAKPLPEKAQALFNEKEREQILKLADDANAKLAALAEDLKIIKGEQKQLEYRVRVELKKIQEGAANAIAKAD